MHHHWRAIIFILLLSFLPFVFIFGSTLLPHTSDGGVQIPRMAAYIQAIRDGHIPVRWAGELNYGYGLPLFNFIYHVPFLISSFFISLGFSLVLTFKLVLLVSFLASGVTMYLFAQSIWKDQYKAFFVTLFYQFAPFRLVEIFVRGAIGGIYAYAFFPLLLYGITNMIEKNRYRWFALTSVSTALLVMSHNSLALVFFGISLSYAIFFGKHMRTRVSIILALASGLALSAWYWMPAILEHKYTYGDLFMQTLYKDHFVPIQNFFIPNLTNIAALRTAEISVHIGIFHTIAILLTILLLVKRQLSPHPKLYIWSLILILISLVFTNQISSVLWKNISLLRQFQFPWRLLAVVSFASAVCSISFFSIHRIRKNTLTTIGILCLMILSTAYYWYPPQGFEKADEQALWKFPLNTTYFGETDLTWSAGPASAYPKERLEVIGGMGTIKQVKRITQQHIYEVHATSDIQVVEHTQYYPGWRVYIDDIKAPIEFQDANWRGLMTFTIPKGIHNVRVEFGENPLRLLANALSALTALGLCIGMYRLTYTNRILLIS